MSPYSLPSATMTMWGAALVGAVPLDPRLEEIHTKPDCFSLCNMAYDKILHE